MERFFKNAELKKTEATGSSFVKAVFLNSNMEGINIKK